MTPERKVQEFRKIVNEMADLYEKKNKNYGNSFGQLFEELGSISGLVPLWNKLHRATSLIKGNQNNFESLEDTFKDLACYAIMNLIEMKAAKQSDKSDLANGGTCDLSEAQEGFNYLQDFNLTDPCYGCETQKMLSKGINYIGDLPCQWCDKNPYKLTCGGTTVSSTTTHTLNNRNRGNG